jgi:DNA-binding NarL/FixJ family response regulator
MNAEIISIAFVDDHPVLLEGMKSLFAAEPFFRVVATGSSASEAKKIAEIHAPKVLFMDLSMPGDVFSAIAEISRLSHRISVVVFTAFSSVDSAMRALDAGAMGFILKGATFEDLFEAVECVQRGEMFITKQYASQVLSGLRNRAHREALNQAVRLNVREKQIVQQLMHARTNREIASTLSISEKTVKRHMTSLMLKLNARNRVEVVIEAQKNRDLN